MVDKHVADNMVDILSEISPRTWEDYDKRKPRKYYKEVHYDSRTDELILQVVDKNETYVRTTQTQYLQDIIDGQKAMIAKVVKNFNDGIDYNKPPKNFKDAQSRPDAAEWMESYRKECQGFLDPARCA